VGGIRQRGAESWAEKKKEERKIGAFFFRVPRQRVSTPPVLDHFSHAPSAGVQSARSVREKYLSRRACAVDRRAGYRAPRASRRVSATDRARNGSTSRSRTSCSRRRPRWRRPGHHPTRHRTRCTGTRVSISHTRSLSRMPFRAPRRPREARRGGSRRRANPALTRRRLSRDSPRVSSAWRVCDTFGTSRGEGGSVAGRRRFATTCRFCREKSERGEMNPRFPDLAVAAGTGRDATHDAAKPRAPRGIDRGGVSRWHERESATAECRVSTSQHAPPAGVGRPNNDASRNVLFRGVAF
jgi:hypothetical protein